MSLPELLAAAAGFAGAAAIVDLAGLAAARRARRRTEGRSGPPAGLLLARLGRAAGAPEAVPRALEDRILAAGSRLAPAEVVAAQAGGALAGLLAFLPLTAAVPGRLALLLPLAAAAAAYLVPPVWLGRRARARAAAAAAELADVLDLLRVAVQAGLPVRRALAEVGRHHDGVLARELRAAVARMEVGVARDAALADLTRRLPLPGVAAAMMALRRAETAGTPPAPALRGLAAEARADAARRRAEAAARAAPQIQLVIALLLVPSVLLLVAAALVPPLTG